MFSIKCELKLPGDEIWWRKIDPMFERLNSRNLIEIAMAQFICLESQRTEEFLNYLESIIIKDKDINSPPSEEDSNGILD